jgi:hypothetical protein
MENHHKLQQVAEDYQPGDHLKEGILLLVQPKVWKKLWYHTSTKTALFWLCWCCLFTENFQLLGEQTNMYYQQHVYRQAGPSRQLPDITLHDMMTFIALALLMGHNLKDKQHDYCSRLRQLHTPFFGKTMACDRFFTHTALFAFCRQFRRTWTRWRIWLTVDTVDNLWHIDSGLCKIL